MISKYFRILRFPTKLYLSLFCLFPLAPDRILFYGCTVAFYRNLVSSYWFHLFILFLQLLKDLWQKFVEFEHANVEMGGETTPLWRKEISLEISIYIRPFQWFLSFKIFWFDELFRTIFLLETSHCTHVRLFSQSNCWGLNSLTQQE